MDSKWADFIQETTGMHLRTHYKHLWEQWQNNHKPNSELVIVIEITVPWDTKVDEQLASKTVKYTEVIDTLNQSAYNAKLIWISIGALGTITPKAAQVIRTLGLNDKGLNDLMVKLSRVICTFSGKFYALRWCKNIQEQEIDNNYPTEIV